MAALAVLVGVVAVLWKLPWFLDHHNLKGVNPAQATTVSGLRTALLAILAGILALAGLFYTDRTLRHTREAHVTDRYTKAIGQIASDSRVEQLGGIYALERIMRDSAKDHATIVEVLAAFVREHAPASAITANRNAKPRPTEPVQAALTVLGRRPQRDEPFRVNLSDTDLRGAALSRARLGRVDLGGAHLENAQMVNAQLQKAWMHHAHLQSAVLFEADLSGAYLATAMMNHADLTGANLERAYLLNADLTEAVLAGANLQDAYLSGANLRDAHLEGARLLRANLSGVDLSSAELDGAEVTVAQLVAARPQANTRLPAELTQNADVRARIAAVEGEEESRRGQN